MARADTSIELVPYDPAWPARFEAARRELLAVLPAARIEHIGSTSVLGMSSKDTVDIAAGVVDVDAALDPEVLTALARLGYAFVPASFADDPHHAFLQREVDGHRTEHLHVMAIDREPMTGHLLFRELLRSSDGARRRYEEAKQRLFREHHDRRDDYVRAKGPIVEALLAEARALRDGGPATGADERISPRPRR